MPLGCPLGSDRTRSTSAPAATLGLCLVASIAVAGGCSVPRPRIEATEARIAETGGSTTRLDIVLGLTNTGSTDVELVNYDYTVSLEDGSSYGGRWAALRALPPNETVQAVIPAVVPSSSAREGARWTVRGQVSYRDPQSIARILYEAGFLKTEADMSGSGTLAPPAAKAVPAAPAGPGTQG
jgi:hypothetical protein